MRIAALLAANVACLAVLWIVLRGGGEPAAAAAPRSASTAAAAPLLAGEMPAEPAGVAPRAPDPWLTARVRKRIADALRTAQQETGGKLDASEVRIAVHAREVGIPGDLVAIDSDRPMRPASNQKLATSAAALVLLGRDGRFVTRFGSAAPLVAGRLQGDLVVRAGGDPIYDADDPTAVDAWFTRAVAALRAAGIAAVDGALVLDEAGFLEPGPGPAWPAENQRGQEFCALAGGFSVNAGCLSAIVRPLAYGSRAEVEIVPRDHGLVERIDVTSGAPRSVLRVALAARPGSLRVDGSVPRDVPSWTGRCAAPDPVELFGEALSGALRRAEIAVAGGVRRERGAALGARELARVETPVASVLPAINRDSNNACADQLFFALGDARGHGGTREGGRAAVAEALERLGVPSTGLVQVDGSGLSRDGRLSARQIASLIGAVLRLDAQSSRLFVASLAVGGESGTLDDRLRGPLAGRVHAKTGFISGTSALSGLIDAPDGRAIVFSILVEYPGFQGLNTSCWKPMQDEICAELANAGGRAGDG